MRVGLMGGTFDPIHIAHLVLADQAREQLALDGVLFMPAGDPWRKGQREITPAEHRLAMTRLAVDGREGFKVDDLEVRRRGPTYTVETLQELRRRYGPESQLFLLLGEDALTDLPFWRDPEGIAAEASIVVAPRADFEMPEVPFKLGRLLRIEMPAFDISSTDLRRRAQQGRSLRFLVPDPVIEYIDRHGLYNT
jgi:nicotinate-nucleotide adenylyltransferase